MTYNSITGQVESHSAAVTGTSGRKFMLPNLFGRNISGKVREKQSCFTLSEIIGSVKHEGNILPYTNKTVNPAGNMLPYTNKTINTAGNILLYTNKTINTAGNFLPVFAKQKSCIQ
jgi:hypothetical protein